MYEYKFGLITSFAEVNSEKVETRHAVTTLYLYVGT